MIEQDSIIIKKIAIHILDGAAGMPVLSDTELDFGVELSDFFKAHIARFMAGDDVKYCQFEEDSEVKQCLDHYEEGNFVPFSQALANGLFPILHENPDIPAADLAVIHLRSGGDDFIALLKLNYRTGYTHLTQTIEDGNQNAIILQQAILPAGGQRLSEAVMIRLTDQAIWLLERKYELNGKKEFYFSPLYLKCRAPLSQKSKLDIVTKAVEAVNKKYFNEGDVERKMEVKSVIYNELEEHGNIRVEAVKEKLFPGNEDMKQEFVEKVEKYNLQDAEVSPQNPRTTKKFEKQHLLTDTGIEITIPMEVYNNKDRVQFITNPDGTVSILIQNIGSLSSK